MTCAAQQYQIVVGSALRYRGVMMSLPVSATEGVVAFVATVLLLLKELLFLLAGDGQTLGNQELMDEPVTDDRGGLAPVWEFKLKFGLNHLAARSRRSCAAFNLGRATNDDDPCRRKGFPKDPEGFPKDS